MIENEVHMSNEYKYSLKEFSEYLGKSEIEILQMVSMGKQLPEVYSEF